MKPGRLTQQILTHTQACAPKAHDWLEQRLQEHGPWDSVSDEKQGLNCLFRYHLGQLGDDTREAREYLNNDDCECAWLGSVVTHVVPLLET